MRRIALVLAALVAGVVLAACGGSTGTGTGTATGGSASGDHNAADVTFARNMIPHHRQAIEMAAMAANQATSPEVKTLAGRIQAAQQPEIKTMSGWLQAWGEAIPTVASTSMGGHGDDSSTTMPGMMSGAEMNELMAKSGDDFDRAFLTMMAKHHEGAIEMARTEQAQGRYIPARTLATKIIKDQQAEIQEINSLLASL